MPIITNFEDQIIRLMKGHQYGWFTTGVNLGGVTGVSGGTGGPIGGFTGQLRQDKVTFDLSENEIWTVPISGESLVNNLDRIRYRIAAVEDGGGGTGDTLVVQWDDAQIASGVIYLNFEGGVEVVDDGGSKVTVTVSGAGGTHDAVAIRGVSVVDWEPTASGEVLIYDGNVWAPGTVGGGAITFLDLTDTPSDYTGYGGYSAVVNIAEDGLEFINVSGGAGAGYTFAYDDVTSQVPDGSDNFTLAATPASGTLVVHYNGITQQPDNYSIITGGFHTLFSPVSGEELTAEYYTDVPQGSILGLTLEVQDTDVTETTNVAILNFEGMSVTDEGSGKVTISGGTGGGGASTLDELTDVVITSVANNELLAYDTGGNWINQTAAEAGLPTTFLALTDVTESSYTGFAGYSAVVNAGEDGLEFVNVSGGSGGEAADTSVWFPDVPPASGYSVGGTEDDEFNDASFDTGIWTVYDEGSRQTETEAEYGLNLSQSGTDYFQGVFQPVPTSSDWSFTTFVGHNWYQSDNGVAGIMLLEDIGSLSTSDVFVWGMYRGGAGFGWRWAKAPSYNGYTGDGSWISDARDIGWYLRLRVDGSTWYFDWSLDGYTWIAHAYTQTEEFTAEGIGLGYRVASTSWSTNYKFARFRNTSAHDQMLYGDRVSMWRA